ncbi:response regulator [Winogradskyella bathintestinalis]|uniref:histidine kinase n=1 Tax=Winogradskyella bathintestinalis TaxID=3035208 RepID=A0ABT7ZQC1_9FLAO|nr:response regulator [Winogradskyella bathintestinalis]MDN3491204.1 response regulator [Winogradskyella bathintestinalis]
MCFPKSNIAIILFVILFLQGFKLQAQQPLINADSNSTFIFDNYKLDLLVKNDSLYKATLLLTDAISYSQKHRIKPLEAKAYDALGIVLSKMSNFNNAESYHNKALKIHDSLNDTKGIDRSLSGLLNTYVYSKNYDKFDSIYPRAEAVSKALNSEIYFINLEYKIKKDYFCNDNKSMLIYSDLGLEALTTTDFKTLNYSNSYRTENLKENLFQSYQYHKALAKVKLSEFKADGFNLLFALNEEKLKASLDTDITSYRKLATLNYYKYLYYTNNIKNLDSANKYLLKSDAYKYKALVNVATNNTRNGELISKIINSEQKLALSNEIRNRDAQTSHIFLLSTIITSILLAVVLTSFYVYFKARKNIVKINSALQASNKKLIAIDKNRLEFFSILSHELRTPIYGINGLATLIEQEENPEKKQHYLNSLISSSSYISTLIDNILQANKLKFEQKTLHLKPARIENVVKYVLSTVEIAAKNKGLDISCHIDPSNEGEHILIDKIAFSQILINLIYNAIRYTFEGGIKINVLLVKRTLGHVTLKFEIEDTGIGIKEEHRSVVFSAFENKAFLSKNSSGSGLGLFIVKTLLQSHNSNIDFISEPGKGTTFFFETTFKIAEDKHNTKTAIPNFHRNMQVLVVDDNKINLLITKKNIEKIGCYNCEIATNGREAISMIKQKDFDLILMDINMPDMDGFEATKHIRMFNPTVPVIALTALNSAEILIKSQASGINQIITKPYVFDDFKDIVLAHTDADINYVKSKDIATM